MGGLAGAANTVPAPTPDMEQTMIEATNMLTTTAVRDEPHRPTSAIATLIADLPAEEHDDVELWVNGIVIVSLNDGACLSIGRADTFLDDGRVTLSHSGAARLAAILRACHSAAGGAPAERSAAAAAWAPSSLGLPIPSPISWACPCVA
jgi:hypothetical protein